MKIKSKNNFTHIKGITVLGKLEINYTYESQFQNIIDVDAS